MSCCDCDCEACMGCNGGEESGREYTEAEKQAFQEWCKTDLGRIHMRLNQRMFGLGFRYPQPEYCSDSVYPKPEAAK